jgi:hypothetical protein
MMTDRGAAEGAMARSAEAIVLTKIERDELDRLIRAHSTPQQVALRAWIILLAADGIGNRDSARRLGVGSHAIVDPDPSGMVLRDEWKCGEAC